jgi:hypothetical protein
MAQLDASWLQWLAENSLLEQPVESMIGAMTARGFDRETCERALAELQAHPYFKAARNHQQLHRKLESVTSNLQALWQASDSWGAIEKRSCPSGEEFLERYVRGCRPVVLTDIASQWPAMQRWEPDCLKRRFGQLSVEVQAGRESDPRFEENKAALRKTVRFDEFIDRIVSAGESNDCYLTANNELLKRREFASLYDDIGVQPSVCDPARLRETAFFWVGPRGTNTPLHHDTVMLFHAQVVGRKRWRMISPLDTPHVYNYRGVFSAVDLDAPDLQRHPRFADVKVLEVVVEPGETIFLPLLWWHQVTALDLSVSLSFTNLAVRNDYAYRNPCLMHW